MSRPRRTSIVPRAGGVTPREREVLQVAAQGLTNPEIARTLGCSRATVRTHLEHVYSKLGVANRVAAVVEGMRRGLVDLPVVEAQPALKAVAQ